MLQNRLLDQLKRMLGLEKVSELEQRHQLLVSQRRLLELVDVVQNGRE